MDIAAWLPSLESEGGPPPEELLPDEPEAASGCRLLRWTRRSAATADGAPSVRDSAYAAALGAPLGSARAGPPSAEVTASYSAGEAPADRLRPADTELIRKGLRQLELPPSRYSAAGDDLGADFLAPEREHEIDPAREERMRNSSRAGVELHAARGLAGVRAGRQNADYCRFP